MAKHAAAKYQDRVEAALSPTLRAAIEEIGELCGLGDGAAEIQSIEVTFTTAAAAKLARRLEEEEGLSRRKAIEEAAGMVGLDPDTLRSRLEKWPRRARGQDV